MHGMQSALQRRRHSWRRINVEDHRSELSVEELSVEEKEQVVMLPRLICCALIALTLSQFLSVMAVRAQVQHTIIAASGDAAPAGGNYVTFLNTFALNARGDGTTTTPIALEGTAAPGSTGTFASFANIKIRNDGQVAFIATLTSGVGGVDASNNMGIWVGTSETDLHLLAPTGQLIAGKTLTRLLSLGPLQINSERPIVRLDRFADNSTAVVSSDVDGGSDP
jgi:hypothetical protein